MNQVIADLEKKVEANPNDLESYRKLGEAYDAIGEWDKAAQILQEALVLAPKDIPLHVLRARVLISRRDQGAALAELEAAKKISADDERVLRGYASYYLMTEEME